jgi:hypothetical protein
MSENAAPAPPGGRTYLRVVAVAAAIGIPAALLAALFLALIHQLEHWLWDALPEALGTSTPPWYLVVGLPVVGALIVLAARTLLPGDGGRTPLEGLSAAPMPLWFGPGIALAAIGTLAFGAVLGPEVTVIALGSLVGVAVTRFVRAGTTERAMLASAGSFSAISALFGGPLVAGMMLVEGGVGMGAAEIPALLPGLVAAAVGYLVFVGFGSWAGLDAPGLAEPGLPLYQGTHLLDLLVALAVGVAAALLTPDGASGGGRGGGPARAARHGGAAPAGRPRRRRAGAGGRPARRGLPGRAVLRPVVGAVGGGGDLDEGGPGGPGRQGPRLCREPGLWLPGWSHLPGHLPRGRLGVADGRVVWRLPDPGGRGRRGRGHGGADRAAVLSGLVRGAAGRKAGTDAIPAAVLAAVAA